MTSEFGDPQVGIHGEWEYSTQYYRFQPEARTYPEAFAMLPSCPHPIYGEHFVKTIALSVDGGSIGGGNVTYRRPVANVATEELGMAEENSVSARRYFRFARPVDDVSKALSLIPDDELIIGAREHVFDRFGKIAAARERDGRHVAACEIESAVAEAEARTD